MVIITLYFVAVLVLLQIPMGLYVGVYRAKTGIQFLDGGDETMMRRMRAHANFTEYVPITLLALGAAELSGTPVPLIWGAGCALVAARLLHFAALIQVGPQAGRGIGAATNTIVMLVLGAAILLALGGSVGNGP
ncbi:MAG: MAPEG family protein [Pseudomonadota bacterium]